jgi:hypothetical protein
MTVAAVMLVVLMIQGGLTVSLATHVSQLAALPLRSPQSLSQQRKDQR